MGRVATLGEATAMIAVSAGLLGALALYLALCGLWVGGRALLRKGKI